MGRELWNSWISGHFLVAIRLHQAAESVAVVKFFPEALAAHQNLHPDGRAANLRKLKWRERMVEWVAQFGPLCKEKPSSQKRDLGHPLKVWRLQLC
jgi:hypothetical protein